MIELRDGLILYHGSYCIVDKPDIKKCAKRKDFGQGFYLTTSEAQAANFVGTSILKAEVEGRIGIEQNYGFISKFQVHDPNGLLSHVFYDAGREWLHYVTANRRKNVFPELLEYMGRFDVIAGKIADDMTNQTLTAYIGGAYGVIGSDAADSFCISRLLPDRLKDQYCFKTVKALRCLEFLGSERIWMKR